MLRTGIFRQRDVVTMKFMCSIIVRENNKQLRFTKLFSAADLSGAVRIAFTTHLRFQNTKRPLDHGQQALAFCGDHSAPRQIIKQPRLERLQRPLLLAEEVGLRLTLPFPFRRVAIECVIRDRSVVRCEQSDCYFFEVYASEQFAFAPAVPGSVRTRTGGGERGGMMDAALQSSPPSSEGARMRRWL